MTTLSGVPVLILKEGAQRTIGKDAQRANIMAARVVAEAVRTTLGPKGMDKMLVDSLGDVTITNDGVTILKEMDIQHPAAKMLVEAAEAQDDEVGDGTTTVAVFAGELLKRAEELLGQNIHSTVICEGYRAASQKAQEILNKIAEPISVGDEEKLKKVAVTAMSSKLVEAFSEHLATLAVKAVKQVAEKEDKKYIVYIELLKY